MTTTDEQNADSVTDPTKPHRYVAETSGWRTCSICGRGANASIHRVEQNDSSGA